MDGVEVKEGMRVRMVADGSYWFKGETGRLCRSPHYHNGPGLRDRDGQYWVEMDGKSTARSDMIPRVCVGGDDIEPLGEETNE